MTIDLNWDARRKKLFWRSSHRGIKEMDILMGGFAKARLTSMTEQELADFEIIIDLPDQQLLSWIVGEEALNIAPSPLLQEFLRYRP